MKIIWLADFDKSEHFGGAQQTNNIVINEGRYRGLDIEEVNLSSFDNHTVDYNAIYILNNIANIFKEEKEKILNIINRCRFFKYEHDYMWMHKIKRVDVNHVFDNAIGSIFLSPLHLEISESVLKRKFKNVRLQPSPFYFYKYNQYQKKEKINKSVIYIGGLARHKGIKNVISYAKENNDKIFHFYGWVEHKDTIENIPKNCKLFNKVKPNKIPQLLSKYEYLIHIPNWNEPFGRSIIEGLISGCKLIVNNKIGALSYDWNYNNLHEIKCNITHELKTFWNYILDE